MHEVSGMRWFAIIPPTTKTPGFQSIRKSSLPLLRTLATAALAILMLMGCKGAAELPPQGSTSSGLKEFLLKHEATFDPVRYDPDLARVGDAGSSSRLESRQVVLTALPETTSGFRVQVLFTQDIDQATQLRDTLDSILPDQWVYLVYDAPYYKVRVGNHEERTTATQLAKRLSSFGFKDAWVVPDNILLNIPPKPPAGEIEAIPRMEVQK